MRWFFGILIYTLLFMVGFETVIQKTSRFDPHHFSNYLDKEAQAFCGIVNNQVRERPKSTEVLMAVTHIIRNDSIIVVTGKAMLYLQKDSNALALDYGDLIMITTDLKPLEGVKNPGEFNFRKYLFNLGIYHQAYVPSRNWERIGKGLGNHLISFALRVRSRLIRILYNNGISGDELAVLSALVLGSNDMIDKDLIRSYSAAGVVHILSVSGLHVGMIYIVLDFLLTFLRKVPYGHTFKNILVILGIWAYALVTGLSPPVLRAAAMFTLLIIGRSLSRQTDIYNTLAASAFLLLLIDPYFITQIGFQLSYLALAGIVTFQQPLQDLWEPQSWLTDKIWSLIVVSVAAQIITFPLATYYFNQFPVLFIITNLIIIPLSSWILYGTIIIWITSFSYPVSSIIALAVNGLTHIMNSIILTVEKIPGAVARNLMLHGIEVILIYVVIVSTFNMLLKPGRKYIIFLICTVILIVGASSAFKIRNIRRSQITVYDSKSGINIEFYNASRSYHLEASEISSADSNMNYVIKNHRRSSGIKDVIEVRISDIIYNADLFKKGNYLQFLDQRVMLLQTTPKLTPNDMLIQMDLILIFDNPEVRISDLVNTYRINKLIIASSNKPWKVANWKKECEQLKIPYYIIPESGAFIKKW